MSLSVESYKASFHASVLSRSILPHVAMATAARNIADGSSNTQKRSSDGCLTCRKRKVKCDENKPRCSACVRLDRTCSWDRQWKFRDLTALVTEEYHVISADEDLDQYAAATKIAVVNWRWCRVQSSKSYPRDVMRSCPPATTSDRDRDTKVVGSRGWSLPPEMNSVPSVRSQLLNTALFHYLPSDELNLAREDMKLWFTPENRLLSSPRSLALTAAIDAFSMAQAALTLREARFASSSVRRYIAGVAALRSALSYTRASTRDELIITMLIFQLIEVRHLLTYAISMSANGVIVYESDIARRWLGSAHCWCSTLCRKLRPMEAPRSAAGGYI